MSEEFEERLRTALRSVAPSEDFTRNLIARAAAATNAQAQAPRPAAPQRISVRPTRRYVWRLAAGVAACVLAGTAVLQQMQRQRSRAEGVEARREVVEALRVTSQKLNLAYEAVKSQSQALSDGNSGA